MIITRDNYEEYFLDYIEGNLDQTLYDELLDFLNSNPDLKEELILFRDDSIILTDKAELNYPGKENLKKADLIYDDIIIASIEGDLSKEENQAFLERIEENLALKDDYLQYKKTKLKPDLSINFSDKSSLKRSVVFGLRRRTVLSFISAAASIILLFSVYFSFNNLLNSEKRQYSERTEKNFVLEPSQEIETEIGLLANKLENISSVEPDKEKKKEEESTEAPEGKDKKTKKKSTKTDKLKKIVQPIIIKRDSLNTKLEKLSPSSGNLPLDKNKKRSKPILKPVEIQSQGLLADAGSTNKEYLSVKELLGKSFKKNILKKDTSSYSLNAWDFAEAGLQGINKLTGSELELQRKYNEEGDVVAYSFNSGLFSFERGLNSSQ